MDYHSHSLFAITQLEKWLWFVFLDVFIIGLAAGISEFPSAVFNYFTDSIAFITLVLHFLLQIIRCCLTSEQLFSTLFRQDEKALRKISWKVKQG